MEKNHQLQKAAIISGSLNFNSFNTNVDPNNQNELIQRFKNHKKTTDFCILQTKLPSKTTRTNSSISLNHKSVSLINKKSEKNNFLTANSRLITSKDQFLLRTVGLNKDSQD